MKIVDLFVVDEIIKSVKDINSLILDNLSDKECVYNKICLYSEDEDTLEEFTKFAASLQDDPDKPTNQKNKLKPFQCVYCSQSFTRNDNLLVHIKIHTQETPYKCPECHKQFSPQQRYLARHSKIHTEDRPYKCTTCQGLQNPSHLTNHTRTHTGERPYTCQVCNNRYSNPATLGHNVKTHMKQKPYQCKFCNKEFSRRNRLVTHTSIHTGKPYRCDLCDKAFTEAGKLAGHMNTLTHLKNLAKFNGIDCTGNEFFPSASSNRSSMYSNSTQGLVYLDSPAMSDTEELYPGAPVAGVPGIPGAADLSDALRRLTPAEVMTRRAVLSGGPLYADYDYDNLGGGCGPITGWRTPDSVMSTGGSSSGVSSRHSGGTSSGVGGSMWRPPRDVLQLVKPMEGSHTLRHWSRLATPTLAGLLEERPGVQIRGGRGLDELGMELYTLSDLEEDDDISLPGKRFQNSGCVYTYTNSTVMHPDDGSICGTSEYGSRLCSAQPTPGTQTPAPRTRSNSTCSTFSTNMGLASVLNERGMQSGVPSCFNTPASVRGGMFSTSTTNGQDYTPTATPCNSPDGSPIATPRCSSPEPVSPHAGIASLLSQGADLLWRTFGTGLYPEKSIEHHDLSPSDTKSVSSIGLVDSVKRLGLESLIIPPGDTIDNRYGYNEPLSLHLRGAGSVVTRRNDAGPMARLASIRAALKEAEAHSEGAPRVQPETPKESKDSASPKAAEVASPSPRRARGGAAADRRARMRERRITRTDLGTVVPTGAKVKKDQEAPTTTSTEEAPRRSAFGAIGALLFGRKGGLL
ncbi:trafficking kinesin-binding protein milt-like [Ctenocephalides felis]|uniref:trafficking kinesin-binding protein milt-like n=1 Tax=Ctenocephalides felis TaxID=7515 RepID=UPI000E6E113D|nr:trafficking kinesin-binding protein milt-like [Ctenocephalides felis]